jgi:hypothetical protein
MNNPTHPAQRCRLYEKGWQYTKADATDVRKTFARFAPKPQPSNVQPLKRSK